VQRRTLAKSSGQLIGVHGRNAAWVEVPDPVLQLHRARKGLLHRHLLVEREADEQRQRVGGVQAVGLVVAGVVESVGRRDADGHARHGTPRPAPGLETGQ
jgi:hypothetical protein